MRILFLFFLLFFSVTGLAQEESLIRYGTFDSDLRALSFGVATWTDETDDLKPAVYGSFNFVSILKDTIRLGFGIVAALDDERPVDLRLHTNLTVRFGWLETGVWYAPFWGLVETTDDPYGFMIGVTF